MSKTTENKMKTATEYGIRWFEFDRSDRRVQREKFFKTEKARAAFAARLETKDNFAGDFTWSEEA